MTRLYTWAKSDTRRTAVTSGGDEQIVAKINWGSRGKSILAGRMRVFWGRDEEKPTLYIKTGDVNVVME